MAIIIVPPTMDWLWMKQRPQQLMSELGKRGHYIFYGNKTQKEMPIEEIEPNLFIVHTFESWSTSELPKLRESIAEPVFLWCTLPFQIPWLDRIHPDWTIYDCADEVPEWARCEADMVNRADLVICASRRLSERFQRWFPQKRVYEVPNGYDTSMELHLPSSSPLPEELSILRRDHALIGYIGAWAPWVNEGIVQRISRLPQVEMIVIGPEFGRKFPKQHKSGGRIHFLGLKPHDKLRDYIRALDVCIIPFHLTPMTLACHPIKAYEYAAAGKAVITTDLPECRPMAPHLDIAHTAEQFISLVQHRIDHPGHADGRIRFALNHTWGQRAYTVDSMLCSLIRSTS